MEFLLVVIFISGYIAFRVRGKRTHRRYHEYKRPVSRKRRAEKYEPYDSDSARRSDKAILQGAAYVIDGDTIVVEKTQIRLFGVDAPEIDHPFGKKAKWALVSLCKGQPILAEVAEQDVHGRTVARCYLPDGRDLSAEMVRLGLALDWPKFSGGKYRSLELPGIRRKLWLADARQKGRLHVWQQFEAKNQNR